MSNCKFEQNLGLNHEDVAVHSGTFNITEHLKIIQHIQQPITRRDGKQQCT